MSQSTDNNAPQTVPVRQLMNRALMLGVLITLGSHWLRPGWSVYLLWGVGLAFCYALSFIVVNRFWQHPSLVVFSLIRILFFGYLIGGILAPTAVKIGIVLCGFLGYLCWLMLEFVVFPLVRGTSKDSPTVIL